MAIDRLARDAAAVDSCFGACWSKADHADRAGVSGPGVAESHPPVGTGEIGSPGPVGGEPEQDASGSAQDPPGHVQQPIAHVFGSAGARSSSR